MKRPFLGRITYVTSAINGMLALSSDVGIAMDRFTTQDIVFGNKDCVGADKSVCLGTSSAKAVPILPGRRRGEEERQKYEESREVDQGKVSQ